MAVQLRLGLLSEQRAWIGAGYYHCSAAGGTDLIVFIGDSGLVLWQINHQSDRKRRVSFVSVAY